MMKFEKNPTLTIRFENMSITDNWEILTIEKGVLLGKNWRKVALSEPTEIVGKIIKGDGWKLTKIGRNYILAKK